MPASHVHRLRVYYEDTDFSGFVYHASYLKFFERGRTELLRARGIVHSTLHREADGLAFVVSRLAIDYLKPAVMDDWLAVTTTIERARGASLMMVQALHRDETCLARAEVTVAAVRGGRVARLPAEARAALGGEG